MMNGLRLSYQDGARLLTSYDVQPCQHELDRPMSWTPSFECSTTVVSQRIAPVGERDDIQILPNYIYKPDNPAAAGGA